MKACAEVWLVLVAGKNVFSVVKHMSFLITLEAGLCEVNTDTAVRNRNHLTATGNHTLYGITQCYLPPGIGDFPAFTPAEASTRFSDPGGMQG